MEESNLTDPASGGDPALPASALQEKSTTACESHSHVESSKSSLKSTETAIREFECTLEAITESKKNLLEQFTKEKAYLTDKHEQSERAMRHKHKICEDNFRKELENSHLKYKDLEEKRAADLRSLREQINQKDSELAETRRQAELTKQELENVVAEKERAIHALEGDNTRLQSSFKILSEEIKSKTREFEIERHQYKSNQEEDSLRIEQLKKEISSSNKETSRLQSAFDVLTDKYRESQESYLKLKADLDKISDQLQAEEKVKHEKIEAIHSLTATLDESKSEIEQLRKNVAELETCRVNEVKELRTQLFSQESAFEKRMKELQEEKARVERELREETLEVQETVKTVQSECALLRTSLEQKSTQSRQSEQQYERKIEILTHEREAAQAKVGRLEEQMKELDNKLTEANVNCDVAQKELNKLRTLMENTREELDKRKIDLNRAQEEVGDLKVKYSVSQSEIEDLKHELEAEKISHREKSKQVRDLRELLSSSQSEVDQLKNANDKLKRSIKEQDELLQSLESDREAFRNTLAEVEKSRHEIKAKWDKSKYSCIDLEHKLGLKEEEVNQLKSKMEKLTQDHAMMRGELEIAGKSLYQMRQLNEKLHEQTLSLQKRNSSLESIKLDSERKHSTAHSAAYSADKKDLEILRIKRENEELSERVASLEREKRRVERSYANLEKEYSTAMSRSTSRPSAVHRTPSPTTTTTTTTTTDHRGLPSDHSSSLLSISRLLSDTTFLNSTMGVNTKMNFSKVTRGIEALEQHHMEIQQKVLGLENLIESASSEGDANTTKQSEDFKMTETGSAKSGNSALDYNGNYNEADEKLKMAQMKAQNLIESSSMFEKEMSNLKSSRSRSQSLRRPRTVKTEDGSEQEE